MNIFFKQNKKKTSVLVIVLFLSFVLVDLALAQTWTPPTETAPAGNTLPPVNVSGISQIKPGTLVLGIFEGLANYLSTTLGATTQTVTNLLNSSTNRIFSERGNLNIFGQLVNNKREVKIWDNLTVVGTTTTNNLVVNNYTRLSDNTEICTAAGACTNINLGSQWLNASDGIYYKSGKVGIGTNSLVNTLTVKGSGITNSKGQPYYWNGYYSSGFKYFEDGYAGYIIQRNDNGDMTFNLAGSGLAGNAATMSEKMRITNGGNVGVGTSNPTNKLHVVGGVRFENLTENALAADQVVTRESTTGVLGYKLISEIAGGGGTALPTGTVTQTLRHNGTSWVANNALKSDGTKVSVNGEANLNGYTLAVGNADIVGNLGVISNAKFMGKVGIQTTDPNELLQIGNASYDAPAFLNVGSAANRAAGLRIVSGGVNQWNLFKPNDDSGDLWLTDAGSATTLRITQSGQIFLPTVGRANPDNRVVAISSSGALSWENFSDMAAASGISGSLWSKGTGDNIYRSLGNVGIGTTAPGAQLHTTGTVRLAGLSQQSAYPQVVVRDTTGNLGYKPLTEISGGTSGLPAASLYQTLYYGGASWKPASNLTNNGTNITSTGIITTAGLSVPGVAGVNDLTANKFKLNNFQDDGLSYAYKVMTSDASGNAIWASILSLKGVAAKAEAGTDHQRVVTMDALGNLGWKDSMMTIRANFMKDEGVNSTFTRFGEDSDPRINYITNESNPTWLLPWTWGQTDYMVMICPADYSVISGGVSCADGNVVNSNLQVNQSSWGVSCGNALNRIHVTSVTCIRN